MFASGTNSNNDNSSYGNTILGSVLSPPPAAVSVHRAHVRSSSSSGVPSTAPAATANASSQWFASSQLKRSPSVAPPPPHSNQPPYQQSGSTHPSGMSTSDGSIEKRSLRDSAAPSSAATNSSSASALDARGLGICGAYCILSTICVLHNKFLLSQVFPSENALLLAQNVFTIVFLAIASSTFVRTNPLTWIRSMHVKVTLYHDPGDWIIGVCYSLCVVTGIWSLNYLSVPMFSSIKRCNIVVVWLIEFYAARNDTTMRCLWPTIMFVCGTALMSYYDLQFSGLGYLFGGISCILQSVSFELGKRLVNHGKDLWSVLLINALASTIIQVLFMLFTGEAQSLFLDRQFRVTSSSSKAQLAAVASASGIASSVIAAHLILNGVMIMGLNYTIFLNCSVNSPLAHVVTGNMKAVLTVVSGTLLFAVPLRAMAMLGIIMGLAGGAWFSWVKFQSQLEAAKRKKNAAAATAAVIGNGGTSFAPQQPALNASLETHPGSVATGTNGSVSAVVHVAPLN